MTDNASRCLNAVGLPHSAGSVPVKLLRPTSSTVKDGKELLPAQEAGRTPLSSVSTSRSNVSDAKPPELPHSDGSVPAKTHPRLDCREHAELPGKDCWKARAGHSQTAVRLF